MVSSHPVHALSGLPSILTHLTRCIGVCVQVAADQDLIDLSKLIVGAIIQPLADVGQDEEEVPVVDMGPAGPVRCSRCRAYMCPFFKFTHDGARMICPICKHNNEGTCAAVWM